MRQLTIFLLLILMSSAIFSQSPQYKQGDGSTLPLAVLIPKQSDYIPKGAEQFLENKLNQIIVANGIASTALLNRFFITTTIMMLTKDIVAGPPMQIAQNMEITFYIADYHDKKIFTTYSTNLKGVGTNETKGYIDAIKQISSKDPKLRSFVKEGRQAIIDYYNSQCEIIIATAYADAGQRKYDKALWDLMAIPDACDCYPKALEASAKVYQQYIDYLCDINLAKAKMAWAAQQNSAGANEAGSYLQYIYPDAKCYPDAELLYKEIKLKVLDDWRFEMKKWQDLVNLESQRINAYREVGVAYGKGQQPNTYVMPWLSR